jgi:anaerobic ribonucleoside-triphosphate reductase activating protein
MLKYINYNIVFQEVPGEVTLAINITGCPNECTGCHSPYLKENSGEILNQEVLSALINRYKNEITCVCFMGGDSDPKAVEILSIYIRDISALHIKTAWYSGKILLPKKCKMDSFDYIKLGPYIEELGGLDSPSTNQRFYKVENGKMIDITGCFKKRISYFAN